VPPGAPTVDKQGPLLPALETNIRLCFVTASSMAAHTFLKRSVFQKFAEKSKLSSNRKTQKISVYHKLAENFTPLIFEN